MLTWTRTNSQRQNDVDWKWRAKMETAHQITNRAARIYMQAESLVCCTVSRACILLHGSCELCAVGCTHAAWMSVSVCTTQDELRSQKAGVRETERGGEVPGCCQIQRRDDEVMHCELPKQYGGKGIISGRKKQNLAVTNKRREQREWIIWERKWKESNRCQRHQPKGSNRF